MHFVCPSIWAWRGGRIKHIARCVDHVLCLFPFEPALLQAAGIAATYVGHPLADLIPLDPPRRAARAALGLADSRHRGRAAAGQPRAARCATSRRSSCRRPCCCTQRRPALRFVLPAAAGLRPALAGACCAQHAPGCRCRLLEGRSHEALAACDVTLIASGTATLEAALFKRPMVIGYRAHWLNAMLFKRMSYLP